MNLEDKIKDLERQLALKKAYASVELSFPKGSKLPDDVKSEVETKVKEFCLKLADGLSQVETAQTSSQFSEDEVTILKALIEGVKNKASKKITSQTKSETVTEATPQVTKETPKMATLLTTDNIPKDRRKLIDSMAKVMVVRTNEEIAVIKNRDGYTFQVPLEDIEMEQ